MNSQIQSSEKALHLLKIKSIAFINMKMFDINEDSIFVEASEHFIFDKCDLKGSGAGQIKITAPKVTINDSTLHLYKKSKCIFNSYSP